MQWSQCHGVGGYHFNTDVSSDCVDGNLNSEQYIHDILEPKAIPFGLQAIGQGFIFQDDNARPHAAHIVQDYHNANLDYTHMKWPAYSPDFNSIEQTC